MKKIFLALALMFMGGATLSTANATTLAPALANISDVASAENGLQRVGDWKHHRRWKHKKHYGHRYYYKGHYKKHFKYYPKGYYKGFCYDKPYHYWCKKYYFKKYKHRKHYKHY